MNISNKRTAGWLLATVMIGLTVVDTFFAQPDEKLKEKMWTTISERSLDKRAKRVIVPRAYRAVRLDKTALAQTLASAPMERTRHPSQNPIVYLPMPDGSLARFRFEESPVIEAGLAARYPQLKATYRAQGIDDPTATSRFDWSPTGFHGIIMASAGTVLIDPYVAGNTTDYITFWKKDAANTEKPFQCHFDEFNVPSLPERQSSVLSVTSGTKLRTYRLALACTNEYAVAVGDNTIAGTLAVEVTMMNRVNCIYERELAIHLDIVSNNYLITYAGDNTSCPGGSCTGANDPYVSSDITEQIGENQVVIDSVIGTSNYDIGHVFSTLGYGNAAVQSVCKSGQKAKAATGIGSVFVVAHEMGHQFGSWHSFNAWNEWCHGISYEPGSGVTIMGYAGLCREQDLASRDDTIEIFNVKSLEDILSYSQEGEGDGCAAATATGNNPPTVTGPGTFLIPKKTPFSLTAFAIDPEGDSITYDWEEYDLGQAATTIPNSDSDGSPRPIFRVYAPSVNPTRTFPSLQYILNNANVPPTFSGGFLTGELLPGITRSMVFQVVARDNRAGGGGISTDTAYVNIDGNATPFAVTSPNFPIRVQQLTNLDVTWQASGDAANVNILLSTDGGDTFPTVLAASVPNDGFRTVLIPDTPTTKARIKIEAVGNIYFDISDTDFAIKTYPILVGMVSLPTATVGTSVTNFTEPVLTSTINASDNLIGFEGDITFDSSVITFQVPAVVKAGITSANWNVSGNVLPGAGPIRTLHILGTSNDGITPLSGSGTLFELKMTRVSSIGAATALTWVMDGPDPVFIDHNQDTHVTGSAPPGSITVQEPTPTATPTPTPDVIAPTLVSARIESDGRTLTNNYSEAVQVGNHGFAGDTTINTDGVGVTPGYVSGAGSQIITYQLNNTVQGADTLTLSYKENVEGITDIAGNLLGTIVGFPIANHSLVGVPTPTPSAVDISGFISYCSNPSASAVTHVPLELTGSGSGSSYSDASGNYLFTSLLPGGSYTVTPTMAAIAPGSSGIDASDLLSTEKHFLGIETLSGCQLTAADVNGDTAINIVDVIAIQRFGLGLNTGIANVGRYRFIPASRTYSGILSDQLAQDYGTLVLGDVAPDFVH